MRIVVLTSEIIDGKIAVQTLINANRDIKAIIYEKKNTGLKAKARLWLLFLTRKLSAVNFKGIASSKKILVRATDNINREENITLLKKLNPEIIIVVGTRKLKKEVFSIAKIGAINLHSGILPVYRGADSEFWALYNNQPEMVGVTIHFIEEGLDSGDIILQERQEVKASDTYNSLRRKNIYLGSLMLNKTISLIESGNFPRLKQNAASARIYHSITDEDRKKLSVKKAGRLRHRSVLKTFASGTLKVSERVARRPFVEFMLGQEVEYPGTFTLRIDADEYDESSFSRFIPVFKENIKATTIFINAWSFNGAGAKIRECKDFGLDIQSHGFYHHTYNDYLSNRQNITKAGDFFRKMGITTKGFAAPYGKWNIGLMRALEEEGYEYSSDFAYDYLGFPTYPNLGSRISKILEIPIFPVAPELFFQKPNCETEAVFSYYKNVVDELDTCGLPIIIYAHTSNFKEVPVLLKMIADYAIHEKKLLPLTMSGLSDWWKNKDAVRTTIPVKKMTITIPSLNLLGRPLSIGIAKAFKSCIKDCLDFERITPNKELCCQQPKKALKILLRKTLSYGWHEKR